MYNLRTIVMNERRQLFTFGFAVLVFSMTLLAHYLHAPVATSVQVRNAGARDAIGDAIAFAAVRTR